MKKRREKRKRLSGLFLAALLLLGSVANAGSVHAGDQTLTGYGMTVTLQIEGYGRTVEQGMKITMPDTYHTLQTMVWKECRNRQNLVIRCCT